MPSFDVVSKLDWSEVNNALDQARRELAQRFDFKGADAAIERQESELVVTAATEDRVKAAYEVLREKLARRKVSLKHFEDSEPAPGPKGHSKMAVKVTEGISQDNARELVKLVKASKLKVQASMQQDSLRVSGKKRDELQTIIQQMKALSLNVDLQFINFRD